MTKLEQLLQYVSTPKHKNGGQLKNIETAEEPSVIPEGALHAHKHNLDLEGLTKKGIPVIQNLDDSINTFEEVIPYFQEWLDCLSLEVGVEDKWSKL